MEDGNRSSRLFDEVREAIRVGHYSIRTENTYVDWVRRFVLFHEWLSAARAPRQAGKKSPGPAVGASGGEFDDEFSVDPPVPDGRLTA